MVVTRYLQKFSKIGLEVGAPDHGTRADGKVEGADSGLHGENYTSELREVQNQQDWTTNF